MSGTPRQLSDICQKLKAGVSSPSAAKCSNYTSRTLETRTISIPPAEHLHAFVWSRGHARSVTQRRRLRRRDASPRLTKQGRRVCDDATAPTSSWHPCHPRDTYRRVASLRIPRYLDRVAARHDVVFSAAVGFGAMKRTRIRLELPAQHPFPKGDDS